MARSILCVGNAVQDQIFLVDKIPTAPLKLYANDYIEIGGGPAANASAAIARLGGRAALWARVGDDRTGKRVIEDLEQWGVDTSGMHVIGGRRTNVSAVVVDRNGERLILAFADGSRDDRAGQLPLETIGAYDAVLCDVRWPDAAEIVLKAATARGVPSVLDADLTVDAATRRLMPFADYVVFSHPALAELTQTDDPEAGLRRAAERTQGNVSVTLGGDGFAYIDDGAFFRLPGFKVEARDTLAAGDVFHGAFALAIAEGHSTRDAGLFASAVASIKCTRIGGRLGTPDRHEVTHFLARHDSSNERL